MSESDEGDDYEYGLPSDSGDEDVTVYGGQAAQQQSDDEDDEEDELPSNFGDEDITVYGGQRAVDHDHYDTDITATNVDSQGESNIVHGRHDNTNSYNDVDGTSLTVNTLTSTILAEY